MSRSITIGLSAAVLIGLAGCTSSSTYSPDSYASNAVQQANKVEPAVVVGFRQVVISASGTVGAVTGGAAGGILGAQVGPGGFNSALGAVGGTAVGTILGTTIERVTGDTTGWEYIVRKPNGDLLSLTQREEKPIAIGQKVLVITGNQARIVPDYSVAVEEPGKSAPAAPGAPAKDAPAATTPPPANPSAGEAAKDAGAAPAVQAPLSLRSENAGNPAPAAAAPTVTPLPEPPTASPAPAATTAPAADPAPGAAAPETAAPATSTPANPAPAATKEAPAEPARPLLSL